MRDLLISVFLVVQGVTAFPFVARQPGVDTTLLKLGRRQQAGEGAGSEALCPYNPPENHVPAAPITAEFPYNGAVNGSAGKGQGGYLVPAVGDTAHYFQYPTSTDIRGPCPGLNAAANHGFISRDGVVTFNELVDAQQNVYNVGYDLAVLLAVLGVAVTDGDIITQKLSIGCDASNRTSFSPLTTSEPGLDGHNKFEADTSLTRNDFFTAGGDDFSMNTTLFGMMADSTGGNYSRDQLSYYRMQRYYQSRQDNPNFYFGPFSLLLYGAASFLYTLMPSGTRGYAADTYTISHFFGVSQNDSAPGGWQFNRNESIPPDWTNRLAPYTILDVSYEIGAMYGENPVLFGGATGNGGFDFIDFGSGNSSISSGKLAVPDVATVSCLLFQLATERVPTSLNGVLTPTVESLAFVLSLLDPVFVNLGCPQPLTKRWEEIVRKV